jgi:L-amino acid N-acyltransferase YncA
MPYPSHPFAGDADLARMEALVVEAYARLGPHFECAVGDVVWRLYRAPTVRPFDNIRLWQDEHGAVVGYAWLITNGDLELVIHPRACCAAVVPEMLAWAEQRPAPRPPVAWALASNGPLIAALAQYGYRPTGRRYLHLWRTLEADLPRRPPPPAGYGLRAVAGPAEAGGRAALHRSAFPHSSISAEVYRQMMASSRYRAGFDIVVVAPDGTLASAALAWLDATNATGEFEPVATHPDHRRRGLVAAAIVEGMHRLRSAGARAAIVYAEADNAASIALYQGLGFTTVDTQQGFAAARLPG